MNINRRGAWALFFILFLNVSYLRAENASAADRRCARELANKLLIFKISSGNPFAANNKHGQFLTESERAAMRVLSPETAELLYEGLTEKDYKGKMGRLYRKIPSIKWREGDELLFKDLFEKRIRHTRDYLMAVRDQSKWSVLETELSNGDFVFCSHGGVVILFEKATGKVFKGRSGVAYFNLKEGIIRNTKLTELDPNYIDP